MNHWRGASCQRGLVVLLLLASLPRAARAQADTPAVEATSALPVEPSALDSRGRVLLAEQRSEQAYEAYEAGDALRAVELYLDAQRLAPSADILYNVAHIYDIKLGDRRLAMEFYRRCVAEPGATPERVARANQRLLALKEAELAAEPALQAPTAPRPAPLPAAPDGDTGVSARSTIAWSLAALGVAGVGVGVGFGLSAMSNADRANEDCDGNLCNSSVGVDASHAAERDARVATVGFVSGGVLLAAAATLFLLGDDDAEAQTASGDLRWGASASRSQLSVGVSGVW